MFTTRTRGALTVLVAALSAGAYAGDGILGTKSSPAAGPMQAETGGGFAFLQMILALGVVLVLLKFVMPKLVTKVNKKIATKVGGGIDIEESAAFAGGTLYIVRVRSKSLLLSVTSTGVTCLAELDAKPEEPTFEELVEKEVAGPLQPFAVVDAQALAPEPNNEAAAALERLKRLVG